MNVNDVLLDSFDRIGPNVHAAVRGLTAEQLAWAPRPGANSIGWLVWHLTRVQDDHVAEVMDARQVYASGDWPARFGRDDPAETGYGHSAAEATGIRAESADALTGYYDAVAARTRKFIGGLSPDDLDRVVDKRWDPPVTLGVRLVSVIDDDAQHVGQAAFLRGILP
jgi:uncharacterized damage-inducible protein DinB